MATLFIVATPIGNLEDITMRALSTLRSVAVVACEDTRHTAGLMNRFGISKRLISVRGANERQASGGVCALLEEGKDVAYVSDAGTPGISDPGSALVRAARSKGFPVVPIPGPSALAALLSVSGVESKSVTFEGFLSPKPGKRRGRLRELLDREEAFVVYESPFRIVKLLADLADLAPERSVLVGREMTKVHEEYLAATAGELLREIAARTKIVGEFAVLVSRRKMA